MKRLYLLLLFTCSSIYFYAQIPLGNVEYTPIMLNRVQSTNSFPSSGNSGYPKLQIPLGDISYQRLDVVVESGWYGAKVKYHNPKTKTKSTYRLNVKVFNDQVTVISFGDEGSIHSGSNNSGYTYSGGKLSFSQDKDGDIISANTRVQLISGGTTSYFDVEL